MAIDWLVRHLVCSGQQPHTYSELLTPAPPDTQAQDTKTNGQEVADTSSPPGGFSMTEEEERELAELLED